MIFSPFKAIGWVLEKIGQAINQLKLPEKVWDAQNQDYIFKKENILNLLIIDTSLIDTIEQGLINDESKIEWNDLIPDFASNKIISAIRYLKSFIDKYNKFIENAVNDWFNNPEALFKFQGKVALLSGLYNGLIDFIASTLQFIGGLAEAPFDVANNFQDFLEVIDNIWESITTIDWDVFWTALATFFETVKTKLKDKDGEFDLVRIAYIIGFAVAFIGTMFIPIAGWVGKVAKIDKLIPEELLTAMQKGLSSIKKAGKNAKQSALRTIENLFALFAKGKKAIQEFFAKLANEVAEWFLKNKKKYKYVDRVDTPLLGSIRVLKDNSLYLNCLKLVTSPAKNGRHGRQLGKWLAIESEAMVKMYTGYTYAKLNEALFKGKRLNRELKAMKKVLDDALIKLPISKFNKKGLLLRSAYHSEREIKKLFKVGKKWTSKGFFSTTHSEKSLLFWLAKKQNHNVIFKVKGKNGKLIEKAAYMWEEHEVLFKSGTGFFIESVGKIDHPLDFSKKVFEIILKEK
ncbi:ADP-ribosyltransferase [Olleya sp. R77988]|uniref:ADP-ribosyltransferase n=1 Tax=Olleya sp. R77988 TaxID=3093875 RepID=UPI0037C8C076